MQKNGWKKGSLMKSLLSALVWIVSIGLGIAVLVNYFVGQPTKEEVSYDVSASIGYQDSNQELLNRAYELILDRIILVSNTSSENRSIYTENIKQLLKAVVFENQDNEALTVAINDYLVEMNTLEMHDEILSSEYDLSNWVYYHSGVVNMSAQIKDGKGAWIDFRKTRYVSDEEVYRLYSVLELLPEALLKPLLRVDVVEESLMLDGSDKDDISFKVAGRAVNPMMAITQGYVDNKYVIYHELGHVIDTAFHQDTKSIYDTKRLSDGEDWRAIAKEEWGDGDHFSSDSESFASGFAIYLLKEIEGSTASMYGYPESQDSYKEKTFDYFKTLFSKEGITF
ncbi:hypothetical protein [Granulicatella seriolae]|uniref:Uncharacterized protein n=1 Tax=Granulicatella seriolae TaxID=2967226 RepID=A0ABT1WM86_9LACT|nr:hypothetical protein [Granulicatella seriolae]